MKDTRKHVYAYFPENELDFYKAFEEAHKKSGIRSKADFIRNCIKKAIDFKQD